MAAAFSPNKASAIALTCNARSYTSLARSAEKTSLCWLAKTWRATRAICCADPMPLADRASVINSESKQAEEGIACAGQGGVKPCTQFWLGALMKPK